MISIISVRDESRVWRLTSVRARHRDSVHISHCRMTSLNHCSLVHIVVISQSIVLLTHRVNGILASKAHGIVIMSS